MFISYRRTDTAAFAGRLHDSLATAFGQEYVFMDTEGIGPGAAWKDEILAHLQAASCMVVVIGPNWDATGQGGEDWVQMEIAAALQLGTPVLPVLVDSARIDRGSLPAPIERLADYQAVQVRSDWYRTDLESVVEWVAAMVGPAVRRRIRWVAPAAVIVLVAILSAAMIALHFLGSDSGQRDADPGVDERWEELVPEP